MSIFKKFTAILLVLSMTLSLSVTAFAQETQEIDIRVEDAYVDVSCFSDEALTYVETYVVENDAGQFYIIDEATLQELLTEQQYTLVEEQIRLTNEYGGASTYAATGTSSNPYELTAGVASSVSASGEYWFKCATWGATDFTMRSTKSASMVIYKKTLFGKTELNSYTNRTYQTKLISDCAINNGKNTYLICFTPSATSTLTCTITQHIDTYNRSAGAMWRSYDQSAIPDTNMLYFSYWYVPKEEVSDVVDYVEDSRFLDFQSSLTRGTITAASIAATLGGGIAVSIISGIGTFALTEAINFKSMVTSDVREAGGYNSSTRSYSSGVLLKEVMSNGFTYYFVESWDGGTMTGPAGWTGEWTTEFN